MEIRVKLFALLRDRAQTSELRLDLPDSSAASAAVTLVAQKAPALKDLLPRAAIAVNREYVKPDHILNDGDELALIPPVSGGIR